MQQKHLPFSVLPLEGEVNQSGWCLEALEEVFWDLMELHPKTEQIVTQTWCLRRKWTEYKVRPKLIVWSVLHLYQTQISSFELVPKDFTCALCMTAFSLFVQYSDATQKHGLSSYNIFYHKAGDGVSLTRPHTGPRPPVVRLDHPSFPLRTQRYGSCPLTIVVL